MLSFWKTDSQYAYKRYAFKKHVFLFALLTSDQLPYQSPPSLVDVCAQQPYEPSIHINKKQIEPCI